MSARTWSEDEYEVVDEDGFGTFTLRKRGAPYIKKDGYMRFCRLEMDSHAHHGKGRDPHTTIAIICFDCFPDAAARLAEMAVELVERQAQP